LKKIKVKRTNRHHRRSRARGGDNSPQNISIVNEKQHQSFHNVFSSTEPQAICDDLNNIWGDPTVHFFFVRKETIKEVQKLIKQLT
jgi:hypothetical protein